MTDPVRLHPDPSVAIAAYRFSSETRGPKVTHDVALMLGEFVDDCDASAHGGHVEVIRNACRIECRACRVVLRFWTCTCEQATFREQVCRHISRARGLYADERRTGRGGR